MNIKEIFADGRPIVVNSRSDGRNRYILAIGCLGNYGLHRNYLVYGNCLQDAIDNLVDTVGDSCPGFFNDYPQIEKAYWDENDPEHEYAQESYISAGNSGELFTSEIVVLREDRKRQL